jgi:hypothetical protein
MSVDLHPILLYVATALVVIRLLLQESDDILRAAVKLVSRWRRARAQVGGQIVTHIVVITPRAASDQPRSLDHTTRLAEPQPPPAPPRLDAAATVRRPPTELRAQLSDHLDRRPRTPAA